jgi:hypothetical protein
MTGRAPVQFGKPSDNFRVNASVVHALPPEGMEPTFSIPPIRDAAAARRFTAFDNTNFWHGLQNIGPKFDSPLSRDDKTASGSNYSSQMVVKKHKSNLLLAQCARSGADKLPALGQRRLRVYLSQ